MNLSPPSTQMWRHWHLGRFVTLSPFRLPWSCWSRSSYRPCLILYPCHLLLAPGVSTLPPPMMKPTSVAVTSSPTSLYGANPYKLLLLLANIVPPRELHPSLCAPAVASSTPPCYTPTIVRMGHHTQVFTHVCCCHNWHTPHYHAHRCRLWTSLRDRT